MLSKEGIEEYKLLKETALEIWQQDIEFLSEEVLDYPFDRFKIYFQLYGKFRIYLGYDRSIFALKLWEEEQYVYLSRITSEHIYKGFESTKPENIRHNYLVLDKILKERLGKAL